MAFALHDHWVWDFWLADDGETFHLYYLHAPKSLGDEALRHRNARIGHATSADLVRWEDHGEVLGPAGGEEFDSSATWTGSVVRGGDGLWRMFYTGTRFLSAEDTSNIESIGVATSPDLFTWTRQPGPLLTADPRWYETLGTSSWPEEAWRDPWVFADEAGQGWHMLLTARANHGPVDERGVIGHATSPDLQTWTVQPPLSEPGAGFAHLEVPQTAVIDGQPVLLFSCDTARLAPRRLAVGQTGGIWVLEADSLRGPFDAGTARLLAPEALYSGRAIQDRSGAWMMLAFSNAADDGGFGGMIADPFPLVPGPQAAATAEPEGASA